jgi:tetratricopeptide (TPR) repeat protein
MVLAVWQQDPGDRTKAVEAKAAFQEGLAISREVGGLSRIAGSLNFLGIVADSLGEHQEAQAYYQECLVISTESDYSRGLINALNGLGQVACNLGDFQKARRYLQQSLETATSTQSFPQVLETMRVWAAVLAKEDVLLEGGGPGREEKKGQAVELLALVLHHPASWKIYKDRATPLLAELEAELPPDVVAAALERGRARKLEDVVAGILAEG